MFRKSLLFICALCGASSAAYAAEQTTRDFITRITTVKCSGDGKKFEMTWDSAITPLGPVDLSIDGKKVGLGGMRMSFDKGNSTYELSDLKLTLNKDDRDKKTFPTTVQYQGKEIAVSCANDTKLKFFRKRANGETEQIEEPKTTRDAVTRITNVSCSGDGHEVELKFDTAIDKFGPAEVILNGKNLELGGMRMEGSPTATKYQLAGLEIAIGRGNFSKKSFMAEASYNGKPLSLKCKGEEDFKFLRKRSIEGGASPVEPGGGVR